MNKAKIQDIAPHIRLASTELRRDVFNRTYLSFILIMMFFMALMGYGISQIYEVQKDQQRNNDLMAVTNVVLAQVKAELRQNKGNKK